METKQCPRCGDLMGLVPVPCPDTKRNISRGVWSSCAVLHQEWRCIRGKLCTEQAVDVLADLVMQAEGS